jgi:hypothetical protein
MRIIAYDFVLNLIYYLSKACVLYIPYLNQYPLHYNPIENFDKILKPILAQKQGFLNQCALLFTI